MHCMNPLEEAEVVLPALEMLARCMWRKAASSPGSSPQPCPTTTSPHTQQQATMADVEMTDSSAVVPKPKQKSSKAADSGEPKKRFEVKKASSPGSCSD